MLDLDPTRIRSALALFSPGILGHRHSLKLSFQSVARVAWRRSRPTRRRSRCPDDAIAHVAVYPGGRFSRQASDGRRGRERARVTGRWAQRRARRLPFARRLSAHAVRYSEAGLKRWMANRHVRDA